MTTELIQLTNQPEVQEAYQALTKGKKKKDYLFDRKDFQAVRDGVKTMNDVNIATQVRKHYETETGKDLWRKPFINMRSACIIELIEIHKYSEYEVSQCVGNSPKTIRKYYMDQLRADHKREAEQELARADTDLVGDNVGDKSPISPDNTMSRDIPEMVTREQVEQLLEAQKTAILQSLTVSLRTAPDAVKPFRAALEEMEKVHHRGVSRTGQDHGKYRVGRIKAVSMVDTMVDTPPCTSETATDETGHADIESVVARFRDTHFDLTPASAVTT